MGRGRAGPCNINIENIEIKIKRIGARVGTAWRWVRLGQEDFCRAAWARFSTGMKWVAECGADVGDGSLVSMQVGLSQQPVRRWRIAWTAEMIRYTAAAAITVITATSCQVAVAIIAIIPDVPANGRGPENR